MVCASWYLIFEVTGNEGSCLENVRFWLSSVKLHAPAASVIAVGAFSAGIESDNELKVLRKHSKGSMLRKYILNFVRMAICISFL
mmetsp:Transcript_13760/g.17074  ORF Transcript_13760/g.17074 Transcript_13760/m.17074 type:complete len:85 (-) Transcript_13760:337-591(-)